MTIGLIPTKKTSKALKQVHHDTDTLFLWLTILQTQWAKQSCTTGPQF